jgi:hypothetical protein
LCTNCDLAVGARQQTVTLGLSLTGPVFRHKMREISKNAADGALPPGPPQGGPMHFIEQIFGFAPDGGSGLLEVLLVTLFVSFLAVRWRRDHRRDSAGQKEGSGYRQ